MNRTRPEIVGTRLRHRSRNQLPDRLRARHKDQAVDFRCVPPGAPNRDRLRLPCLVLGLALRLDQNLERFSYQLTVLAERDRLLRFHDGVAPLFGGRGRNGRRIERGRFGARLG